MNDSIELQRLREETQLALAAMRGDLKATNLVLHAVIADHPDPVALRQRIAAYDKQLSAVAKDWPPRFRDAYTDTLVALIEAVGPPQVP